MGKHRIEFISLTAKSTSSLAIAHNNFQLFAYLHVFVTNYGKKLWQSECIIRVFHHEDSILHINSFAVYSDCAVPDDIGSILPPEKELQFPERWIFWRTKKFKEMYEA